jgi:hypothetical protein
MREHVRTVFWPKIALSIGFILCSRLSMQADTVQFLPEVDTYLKVTQIFRVYYQNKDDRDGGDSTQFTTGPSLELYMKPLLKLKRITSFDPDDSKNQSPSVRSWIPVHSCSG